MVQNWCQRRSEIYTRIHLLASELGLPICCLFLAMRAMSGCDSVSTFSHIEKKASFQTLKNKINELTHMIVFSEVPSLTLESLSVVIQCITYVIQCIIYLYEENKSGSNVIELRYS